MIVFQDSDSSAISLRSVMTVGTISAETPSPASATREELLRLGEEIAELAVHLDTAIYRLLGRLRDFDARDGWTGGFLSCAHWLSWRTGIAVGAAREKVRVARALGDLPRLSRAMERGELSYSKVRALTRIATPANEEELLELAGHATAAQVETVVRAWRRADRLAEANAERERHERRHLSVHVDDDGSYVLRGRLDPEVGALLERALDEAARALYTQPAPTAAATEVAASDAEPSTAAQRRADALGLLVELALGHWEPGIQTLPAETDHRSPESAPSTAPAEARSRNHRVATSAANAMTVSKPIGRAARVQVVLHVEAEALREDSESGQSVLAGGVRVPAGTSRRLTCDASRVVMTHDSSGRVLDVGRGTRTVPTAIRRALEHRDRSCCFPGCTNRLTDAHHVRHWADGGPTRLENLMLLCRRHHRAVHEDGFRVNATASGSFAFTRPDGRPLPLAPPMPVRSRQRARGGSEPCLSSIATAPSGVPCAPYERLDLDWTMRTLYRLGGCVAQGRPSHVTPSAGVG